MIRLKMIIMKKILVLLMIIAAAGCSASYQAGQQNNDSADVSHSSGASTASKKITSIKGYQPTENDVLRYNNDVTTFLKASVPDFDRFSQAKIMIDGTEAESLKDISLSKISSISVLDASSAVILGTNAKHGVIIIQTK